MGLTEHEQRQFELIERALYADDPKFAAAVHRRDPAVVGRRRLAVAILTVILGVGTLLAGVVLPLWFVGVAGFVVMLGGSLLGVAAVRTMTGHVAEHAAPEPDENTGIAVLHRHRKRHPSGPRASFASRLEERWQRRIDRGNL